MLYVLLYSLLQSRRPFRTTLFPYTTLFRSEPLRGAARAAVCGEVAEDDPGDTGEGRLGERHHAAVGGEEDQAGGGDRKSTRLNSSHVRISYAVLCLKKKKHLALVHISPRIH